MILSLSGFFVFTGSITHRFNLPITQFLQRKRLRKKVADGRALESSVRVSHQDLDIRRVFVDHLPARSTWLAVIRLARDRELDEVVVPLGDGLEYRRPFGTDGEAVHCVLHIHTGEDSTIGTEKGCSNGEV